MDVSVEALPNGLFNLYWDVEKVTQVEGIEVAVLGESSDFRPIQQETELLMLQDNFESYGSFRINDLRLVERVYVPSLAQKGTNSVFIEKENDLRMLDSPNNELAEAWDPSCKVSFSKTLAI